MFRKSLFAITLATGLLTSCFNSTTEENIAVDSLAAINISPEDTLETAHPAAPNVEVKFQNGNVIIPEVGYRISRENEIADLLKVGQWVELYKTATGYEVGKLDYQVVREDEEPCSGMPTEAIASVHHPFFMMNIPSVKLGAVDTVAIPHQLIVPKRDMQFRFENSDYKLLATGVDFEKENISSDSKKTYTLDLYKGGKLLRRLIQQSDYNDTQTQLLFVGDLDKDGIPDFIFSSSRDYEEERYLFILSGSTVVYEETRQFDC